MRLIDADDLIVMSFDDENGKILAEFVPKEFIDEAKTVDAIPTDFIKQVIDWLKNSREYATNKESKEYWEESRLSLIILLHEWDAYRESGCKGSYGEYMSANIAGGNEAN